MNSKNKKLGAIMLIAVVLLIAGVAISGCKKKTPTPSVEGVPMASQMVVQKTCPVTGDPIDENIYTTYENKKICFCSQSCKETFEKEPEKYISKLSRLEE